MRKLLVISATFALLTATSAEARKPLQTGTPANVQKLLGCRSIVDSAQRLACYDREAAGVSQAIASRDLVMIDRARATAAKRSLFGFSVPDFGGLFGGGGDDVKEISSTVTAFARNPFGGWTIRLADGEVDAAVGSAAGGPAPVERKPRRPYVAPQPGLFDAPEE